MNYSLAYLTAAYATPPQAVDIAAQAGYQQVGLRLLPAAPGGVHHPLMQQPSVLRETLARLQDTGISVWDIELIRIGADFSVDQCMPFLETGAKLGARAVLVAGDDLQRQRLTKHYAQVCEACAQFGLTADLEFMPWTAVRHLRDALDVVQAAGTPSNAGVLVDALHFARSASSLHDLASIPRALLHYAQICDAPVPTPPTDAELIHTARCARLPPGEGGIDLHSIFSRLPRDLPLTVEVPHDVRAKAAGAVPWAVHCLDAAKAMIGTL